MAVTQHRDTHIEALALSYSRLRVKVKLTKLLWGSDLFYLFWVSASLRAPTRFITRAELLTSSK